jgi:flagella basal body P-ring formation protein FlgA
MYTRRLISDLAIECAAAVALAARLAVAGAVLLFVNPSFAQMQLTSTNMQGAQAGEPDFRAIALKWAKATAADSAPAGAKLRMEVSVGAVDSRLHLAPCGNIEPYMPQGARLWGNSRVGLRCVDGLARWNISVPATVKAYGQAWVVRGQVAQGAVLTEADVVAAEVDWAEDTSPVLMDHAAWLGQTATRQLTTGMVIRQGLVKPSQVFQAGAQVRVVAQGAGFEISSDAQAMAAGVIGQVTRVRMDNGRITSGVVLDARTVKVDI